ncbi:MAG: HAD hydrolase family protein [Gaiellaceae bacterium]
MRAAHETRLQLKPAASTHITTAIDLSLDPSEAGELLVRAVTERNWLDAFLLSGGMSQVASDHIHAVPWHLGTAVDRLFGSDRTVPAWIAGRTVRALSDLSSVKPGARRVRRWEQELTRLMRHLAGAAIDPAGADAAEIEGAAARVAAGIATLPRALRRRGARLPACFHAFDLDLPDTEALIAAFLRDGGDDPRPLLVVGVPTSGNYLAPLCAAYLAAAGSEEPLVLTFRPRHSLMPEERRTIRKHVAAGGLVLIVDDPPGSGETVARVARTLRRLGVPETSIVLLLPLFGGDETLPERLRRYRSVTLGSSDWAVEAKLAPDTVGAALAQLLPSDAAIESISSIPFPHERRERGHRRELFHVDLVEDGTRRSCEVLVEGVGLGYFGAHAVTVAAALTGWMPRIFGFLDGCLYRNWLPDERRAAPPGSEPSQELLEGIAAYVAQRREVLAVPGDKSNQMFGEYPVWEVISRMFSAAYGRFGPAARLLAFDRLAKGLLFVARPSIVDGSTSLSNWFSDDRNPGRLVKVEFDTRSFWNLGLRCYDALFDIAGATVSTTTAAGDRLRAAYEDLVGETIGAERFLFYELAQLQGGIHSWPGDDLVVERRQSRSLQQYIARRYLADIPRSTDGDLCAIDLDGVLETGAFGFQATTPSGALALRALIAHGYRPAVVSGRSQDEVIGRCRAYTLAGGVAEYGAVVYVAHLDEPTVLLTDADRAIVGRLREVAADTPGVEIDEGYRHVLRAYVRRGGRRQALPQQDVAAILGVLEDQTLVRTVVGWGQTDFVPTGIDKGRGVRELSSLLPGAPRLALAVGDTASDLPMLREAGLALAPANAEEALRQNGIEILRAGYQAGLALAAERLIGHAPGSCPVCRVPPSASPEEALLEDVLALGERSRAGRVRALAGFSWRARQMATRAT